MEDCFSKHNGYICCLEKGHKGKHIANTGIEQFDPVATWTNKDE